jgi:hypothetical protein
MGEESKRALSRTACRHARVAAARSPVAANSSAAWRSAAYQYAWTSAGAIGGSTWLPFSSTMALSESFQPWFLTPWADRVRTRGSRPVEVASALGPPKGASCGRQQSPHRCSVVGPGPVDAEHDNEVEGRGVVAEVPAERVLAEVGERPAALLVQHLSGLSSRQSSTMVPWRSAFVRSESRSMAGTASAACPAALSGGKLAGDLDARGLRRAVLHAQGTARPSPTSHACST